MMSSSSLVAFPIAFGVIYLVVCFSVIVVAIRTGTTSNNTKTPLVCGAGAHPPAYYIYSIGSSISALLFVGSAISHAYHVGDNLVPDQKGFLWIIAGVGCIASIFMAAMGIIPMRDPYKTKHNVVGIIFISLGCCYSGMLVGAAFGRGSGLLGGARPVFCPPCPLPRPIARSTAGERSSPPCRCW